MATLRRLSVWSLAGLLALACVAPPRVARAEPTLFQWNSSATGNWSDAARWTPTGIPGANDPGDRVQVGDATHSGGTVIIDSFVPPISTFNIGEGGVGTIEVRTFGSLVTTTALSSDAIGLNGHGTLRVDGGLVSIGRRLVVNQGLIDILGGSLQILSPVSDLSLAVSGVGELRSRSTLNVGRDLIVGDGGQGFATLTAGETNVGRNAVVGGPFGTGTLTVDGGRLFVAGNLTVGGIAGEGTMTFGPRNSLAEIDGTFAVTNSGTFRRQFGASPLSPLRAASANLAGELAVGFAANFSPTVGQSIALLEVSGNAPHASTFAGKPQGGVFIADWGAAHLPVRIDYQANLDAGAVANDVTLTVLRQGDVNFDGTVNRADLAALVANWHATGGFAQGDLDGDNQIGLLDLMTLRRELSTASPASAAPVPEPASLGTLFTAALVIVIATRRRPTGLARRPNWR